MSSIPQCSSKSNAVMRGGRFPFRLRNSSSPQLFEVDRDCDRELVGGASLASSGFSESKMWALERSLWHNSEPDQVATAHLC